ncbi:hypothetical protein [Endozoicomonas sp. SCSIO W0465]|uniref:hypothetical protein n=1 Tax=Endozoicomonas sp. SCSIO W0465 TaxID=2918516 RepID=UPI002075046B|nr:hypothetical protein [Endozoicomonas sp. SCSIO W0465]USE36772.1 hypothetical protein MJO57_00570 [Endozoicomonas sp. SCSIO W0465]
MIDPVAEGVNPNPLAWNEISWPVKDNPPLKTNIEFVEYLKDQFPLIADHIEDHMINAFHYMIDRWDQPGSRGNVFNFIEKWMSRNQEQVRKINRFFPVANQ